MPKKSLSRLFTLTTSILAALCLLVGVAGAQPTMVREASKTARISYGIPTSWKVQDEAQLIKLGDMGTAPYPPYVLIAGYAANPVSYALQSTAGPWLLVSVQKVSGLPTDPSQYYDLVPGDIVDTYAAQGIDATVTILNSARVVHSGGVSGSQATVEITVPGSGTNGGNLTYVVKTVTYGNPKTGMTWAVGTGCSSTCYAYDHATMADVIASVKVGTAA